MLRTIRYNNNKNVIFIIENHKTYHKIITYRKTGNGLIGINSVKYFPLGVNINFNGNNPYIDTSKNIKNYSKELWNKYKINNKWKNLVNNGNEWTLYQKDILNN
jgi:hypothetical protein